MLGNFALEPRAAVQPRLMFWHDQAGEFDLDHSIEAARGSANHILFRPCQSGITDDIHGLLLSEKRCQKSDGLSVLHPLCHTRLSQIRDMRQIFSWAQPRAGVRRRFAKWA
jgi:hypothetical protein